jgi:AcrR family transcriptional regulator
MSPRQPPRDISPAGGRHHTWRPGASERARPQAPRLAEFQRSRLLNAAAEVASERGYQRMSVTAIVARAGVSRKTFYELFKGREDCLLAVLEESLARMARVAVPAYEGDASWPDRVRAALLALLAFLEGEPDLGALTLSYLLGYGPRSPELRTRVRELLSAVLDEGCSQARPGHNSSALTAELVVGGVLAVIHARLRRAAREPTGLVNPLMWMIVLPYLGPAAAARELARSAPKRAGAPPTPASESLWDLDMRLTYRTARVLEVIAVAPGSSNTEIGTHAQITDQGQASKLLARLARLGLVANTGAGQSNGAMNAWRLTSRGEELESAIRRKSGAGGR